MSTPLGRSINAARLMRLAAKHNDTFRVTKLTIAADGSGCFTFSAENDYGQQFPGAAILSPRNHLSLSDGGSFGGLDFNGQVAEPAGKEFVEMWGRHGCEGGTDETAAVRTALDGSLF